MNTSSSNFEQLLCLLQSVHFWLAPSPLKPKWSILDPEAVHCGNPVSTDSCFFSSLFYFHWLLITYPNNTEFTTVQNSLFQPRSAIEFAHTTIVVFLQLCCKFSFVSLWQGMRSNRWLVVQSLEFHETESSTYLMLSSVSWEIFTWHCLRKAKNV